MALMPMPEIPNPQLRNRIQPRPRLNHKPTRIVLRSPVMNLPKIPTRMLGIEIRHPRRQNGIIPFWSLLMHQRSNVGVAHEDLSYVVQTVVYVDLILSVVGIVEFIGAVDYVADRV